MKTVVTQSAKSKKDGFVVQQGVINQNHIALALSQQLLKNLVKQG